MLCCTALRLTCYITLRAGVCTGFALTGTSTGLGIAVFAAVGKNDADHVRRAWGNVLCRGLHGKGQRHSHHLSWLSIALPLTQLQKSQCISVLVCFSNVHTHPIHLQVGWQRCWKRSQGAWSWPCTVAAVHWRAMQGEQMGTRSHDLRYVWKRPMAARYVGGDWGHERRVT